MSSKPIDKRTKEYRDMMKETNGMDMPKISEIPEDFPYKVGQEIGGVKIVGIVIDKETSGDIKSYIEFVYPKKGILKDEKGRIVNEKAPIAGQWEEAVYRMTLSDFKNQSELGF